MKEIVDRLQENRQVELAKSILESEGYKVSKNIVEGTESNVDRVYKYLYSGIEEDSSGFDEFLHMIGQGIETNWKKDPVIDNSISSIASDMEIDTGYKPSKEEIITAMIRIYEKTLS